MSLIPCGEARKAGSAAYGWTWSHSDHLGSSTVIADKDGNAVRRLAYKPFGEEVINTGTGEKPPYTYTGKERDSSGLLYYGARYYDPALAEANMAIVAKISICYLPMKELNGCEQNGDKFSLWR